MILSTPPFPCERLKEATKINLSPSALGNVISALVDGRSLPRLQADPSPAVLPRGEHQDPHGRLRQPRR